MVKDTKMIEHADGRDEDDQYEPDTLFKAASARIR